jgi:hypothetical protein
VDEAVVGVSNSRPFVDKYSALVLQLFRHFVLQGSCLADGDVGVVQTVDKKRRAVNLFDDLRRVEMVLDKSLHS